MASKRLSSPWVDAALQITGDRAPGKEEISDLARVLLVLFRVGWSWYMCALSIWVSPKVLVYGPSEVSRV